MMRSSSVRLGWTGPIGRESPARRVPRPHSLSERAPGNLMAGPRRVERDDEDLVRLYLTEVGRHELLSKDDEARLAQQIEEASRANRALTEPGRVFTPNERRTLRRTARRGAEAHDVFVQANLRLVVSIAKKYQASGLPLLDLVQDGNVGLIHAVETRTTIPSPGKSRAPWHARCANSPSPIRAMRNCTV